MCRLLLQSRTLKIIYTEKYQNAANLDDSRIYMVTNVHLKERALRRRFYELRLKETGSVFINSRSFSSATMIDGFRLKICHSPTESQ
jgi:hypothetical protein